MSTYAHAYTLSAPPLQEMLHCDWRSLKQQLLAQWKKLTLSELDQSGPNRVKIAALIQRKYGISASLIEHYLTNVERTLPAGGMMYLVH